MLLLLWPTYVEARASQAARAAPVSLLPVVAEVLRAIIGTYRELFKAPALTEAVLFSNYAATALVVDEVCREVGGAGAGPGGRCHKCWGMCKAVGTGTASWEHVLAGLSLSARCLRLAALAGKARLACTNPTPPCLPTCLQGLVELTDRLSIQKAIAMRVRDACCGRCSFWGRKCSTAARHDACMDAGLMCGVAALPCLCEAVAPPGWPLCSEHACCLPHSPNLPAATVRAAGREEQGHTGQAHEQQGVPAGQGAVVVRAGRVYVVTWQERLGRNSVQSVQAEQAKTGHVGKLRCALGTCKIASGTLGARNVSAVLLLGG